MYLQLHTHTHIYIYIYIYIHSKTSLSDQLIVRLYYICLSNVLHILVYNYKAILYIRQVQYIGQYYVKLPKLNIRGGVSSVMLHN